LRASVDLLRSYFLSSPSQERGCGRVESSLFAQGNEELLFLPPEVRAITSLSRRERGKRRKRRVERKEREPFSSGILLPRRDENILWAKNRFTIWQMSTLGERCSFRQRFPLVVNLVGRTLPALQFKALSSLVCAAFKCEAGGGGGKRGEGNSRGFRRRALRASGRTQRDLLFCGETPLERLSTLIGDEKGDEVALTLEGAASRSHVEQCAID